MAGPLDRSLRRLAAAATAATVLGAGLLFGAGPAVADTQPPVPNTPATVSSDALPTVQINGVVWAQVVVGNTVYATGQFTSARPAGTAAGTDETPRANILAYDITTGALKTGFAPSLNAQGLALAASPDGQTIFVGGDFTQINGQNKYRLAALDANTGAVRPNLTVGVDARVRSLAVVGNTLYFGGIFSAVANQPRTRLAAVNYTNSQLLPWAPAADAEVSTMAAHPGGNGSSSAASSATSTRPPTRAWRCWTRPAARPSPSRSTRSSATAAPAPGSTGCGWPATCSTGPAGTSAAAGTSRACSPRT